MIKSDYSNIFAYFLRILSIYNLLLWQPLHGKRSQGRPPKIYSDQLMEYTGCTLDELKTALNERDEWKQRIKNC